MKNAGGRRTAATLAFTAIFAGIAAVTAKRAVALASGRPPLDAAGETRFLRWAYRDPALLQRLCEVEKRLSPGEAVLAVCAPSCDTSWFWTMAVYGLPRAAVVGAKTEGELGRVFPTRVERTRDGVRLLPRSGADPPDGLR